MFGSDFFTNRTYSCTYMTRAHFYLVCARCQSTKLDAAEACPPPPCFRRRPLTCVIQIQDDDNTGAEPKPCRVPRGIHLPRSFCSTTASPPPRAAFWWQKSLQWDGAIHGWWCHWPHWGIRGGHCWEDAGACEEPWALCGVNRHDKRVDFHIVAKKYYH